MVLDCMGARQLLNMSIFIRELGPILKSMVHYFFESRKVNSAFIENQHMGTYYKYPLVCRRKRPRSILTLPNVRGYSIYKDSMRDIIGTCYISFLVHPGWSPCNTVAECFGICNKIVIVILFRRVWHYRNMLHIPSGSPRLKSMQYNYWVLRDM